VEQQSGEGQDQNGVADQEHGGGPNEPPLGSREGSLEGGVGVEFNPQHPSFYGRIGRLPPPHLLKTKVHLAWNRTLNQYLLDLGFESTPADPFVCCYHESSKHNKAYKNEMHNTPFTTILMLAPLCVAMTTPTSMQ